MLLLLIKNLLFLKAISSSKIQMIATGVVRDGDQFSISSVLSSVDDLDQNSSNVNEIPSLSGTFHAIATSSIDALPSSSDEFHAMDLSAFHSSSQFSISHHDLSSALASESHTLSTGAAEHVISSTQIQLSSNLSHTSSYHTYDLHNISIRSFSEVLSHSNEINFISSENIAATSIRSGKSDSYSTSSKDLQVSNYGQFVSSVAI